MTRKHPAIPPPHFPMPHKHRQPQSWRGVRRAWRLAALHAVAAIADSHAWNALALTAMAALTAVPAEVLAAHAWLRAALPITLAAMGVLTRAAARHGNLSEKTP